MGYRLFTSIENTLRVLPSWVYPLIGRYLGSLIRELVKHEDTHMHEVQTHIS